MSPRFQLAARPAIEALCVQSAILQGLTHNGVPGELAEAVFQRAIDSPVLKQASIYHTRRLSFDVQ